MGVWVEKEMNLQRGLSFWFESNYHSSDHAEFAKLCQQSGHLNVVGNISKLDYYDDVIEQVIGELWLMFWTGSNFLGC